MIKAIIDNAGAIADTLVLIGLVAAILIQLRRDKKKGKSSCGCSCGCCPMAGTCHKST